MKVGDLVRRKDRGWLAIILAIKESGPLPDNSRYVYPEFMWLDTGEIQTCSFTLLEIVSEIHESR